MKFAIITHALHYRDNGQVYAYAPYVSEMNLWGRHVDEFIIVAPSVQQMDPAINIAYQKKQIRWYRISAFSLVSFASIVKTIFLLPVVLMKIFRACGAADHIHLRCPGNVGLLGCLVQIFFPNKPKTAKYAGNWDPKSRQPKSYRLQKWILGNTFLTRNMKVLVYGDWLDQSKNIIPFFTASYSSDLIPTLSIRTVREPYKFLFVGSLSPGKRPEYVVEIIHSLVQNGLDCVLNVYGDGSQRVATEELINRYGLNNRITVHGNMPSETVQEAYKSSHFLVLPSKSEGWPKVVAEAMFWGCLPMVTPISCVPWMLDHGNRGVLLTLNIDQDRERIQQLVKDEDLMYSMSHNGQKWSHQYTLEAFESEIIKFLS